MTETTSSYCMKLTQLVEEHHLTVLRKGKDYEERRIVTDDVSRPGLQLIGFFDYFDADRLELIGLVENAYLEGQTSAFRRVAFEKLFSCNIPALIITRDIEPFPECLEMAEKYDCTLLRSSEKTTTIQGQLITNLRNYMAPRITRHGVLVEISGEGVFICGESGVGKSETAIELIKRGHRLIADDAVEIRRMSSGRLVGTAPELIRHYMELRGIGVVDIRQLFGVSAVKAEANIDLVVTLEPWRNDVIYDRLGLEEFTTTIMDVEVPTITIPVKPGRNLAVILEVAAMNNRHKRMGYNAAQAFAAQIDQHISEMQAAQTAEKKKS